MTTRTLLAAIALVAWWAAPGSTMQHEQIPTGLTAVPGIRVGHHTLSERPTGCTVILADPAAVGGVDVRGAAPGTRETDLLRPDNLVDRVNAIVLSGGSAHGLDAATGVMRYLEARQVGYEFGGAYVPIVPAAVLFDLPIGGKPGVRPDADCGLQAAQAASAGPVAEGNVGAGAGATVGKYGGLRRPMKGGIGTASITLPNGLIVAALAAVNAAGDIVDPATGRTIAGVRTEDGTGLLDVRTLIRAGGTSPPRPGENTTLGVVATNATLSKAQAGRVALMAHDGFARTIVPAHTMSDGDVVFTLATGARPGDADVSLIGALAADVMAEAILRAVRAATGIPGYPAVRDLK